MRNVYEPIYMFFTIGDKIFRDKLLGYPMENGVYFIRSEEGSAYDFFKFGPPAVETLDIVPFEPFKTIRSYPMFSKNESFENYVALLKETQKEEINYYLDKVEELREHLAKVYECEDA